MKIYSFGFKYGKPRCCNIIFDVSWISNPNKSGFEGLSINDDVVSCFLENQLGVSEFVNGVVSLLKNIPDDNLSVGFGCTGGRHRSVFIAGLVAERLSCVVEHLDVDASGGFFLE